jgi:hypothetical protein
MDRTALFVDAGYLLAVGAVLRTGRPQRAGVDCDYVALARGLIDWVKDHAQMDLLRAYWYDAAKDAVPTTEQLVIGRLPEVKLRLGRLLSNRQKGVDSLIVRDLMTLAKERAIATAYLLSGDEDTREGVVAAQDMGVRVVVLGLESSTESQNQADTLIREADLHVVVPNDLWRPFFTERPLQEVLPVAAGVGPRPQPTPIVTGPTPMLSGDEAACLTDQGSAFAAECLERLQPNVIELVRGQYPVIASDLDAELLRRASAHCGYVSALDQKRVLRGAFWTAFGKPAPTVAESAEVQGAPAAAATADQEPSE